MIDRLKMKKIINRPNHSNSCLEILPLSRAKYFYMRATAIMFYKFDITLQITKLFFPPVKHYKFYKLLTQSKIHLQENKCYGVKYYHSY